MYSLNLDYIFNTVYNVLLWIRFTWVFTVWRRTPEEYLAQVDGRKWDGLRDRGWVADLTEKRAHHDFSTHGSAIDYITEKLGIKLPDADGDGIPDVHDNSPYDPENLTAVQMKERYEQYYDFSDKLRGFFGFGPADIDKDGLPDNYEHFLGTDPKNSDSDFDGVFDANEIARNLDPKNPDTDHDGILDGRDAFPLDSARASDGIDTDADGLSDVYEKSMGTDPNNIDTDGDGIPDGQDTYPLDAHNKSHTVAVTDYTRSLDGLHLAVQNPILQFVRDIFSVLSLIALVFLAISFMRFFREFWKAQMQYEHHFGHGAHGHDDHGTGHAKTSHKDSHGESHAERDAHSGRDNHTVETSHVIEGLAFSEGLPFEVQKPTEKDFERHPRWAIIEGYMSADVEALWRIGILEADMMLRDTLLEKGYRGDDVGELLQNAKFATINLAWDAHKIRNRIAHDGSEYLLTDREARRVYGMYEAVFKELKVI